MILPTPEMKEKVLIRKKCNVRFMNCPTCPGTETLWTPGTPVRSCWSVIGMVSPITLLSKPTPVYVTIAVSPLWTWIGTSIYKKTNL